MSNKIVLSGKDGRGIIQVVKSGASHPDYFYLGDRAYKMSARGQIKISAADMKKYGVLRPDGRYALALNIGARYDDGELVMGGNIIQAKSKKWKSILTSGRTGDRIKKRDVAEAVGRKDTKIIEPSDTADLYTA